MLQQWQLNESSLSNTLLIADGKNTQPLHADIASSSSSSPHLINFLLFTKIKYSDKFIEVFDIRYVAVNYSSGNTKRYH